MKHSFSYLFATAFLFLSILSAKAISTNDFSQTLLQVDSLYKMKCNCSKGILRLDKVVKKGRSLDFYFTESLSDFPVRPGDAGWLRKTLEEHLPVQYSTLSVGNLYYQGNNLEYLAIPSAGNNGTAGQSRYTVKDHRAGCTVQTGKYYDKGLSGRNIAIWQSHGYYYNIECGQWMWQRPCLFQTVEDLYTQSYVVPFLAPMLENAGAFVMLPRERDWNREEIIIDNDPSENVSERIHGSFRTESKWQTIKTGFADTCSSYTGVTNPFKNGTALKIDCTANKDKEAQAIWTANIPCRGEYAVYVTYQSLARSCPAAVYYVHSMGCDKKVRVDQRKGGGTWMYIGTYEFDAGLQDVVSLSNLTNRGGIVCADAVKIGGGMGNVARGENGLTSGRPRFAEGARYFLQWSGMPEKVWSQNELKDDYRDDLMSRGAWVSHLSGGSWVNPNEKGLGIPVDLSLAFHTDAGESQKDEIIGTLSIYTLNCDKSTKLPEGCSRQTCRELADFVQTQVVDDIRSQWDSLWVRRMLWNRSYSESRTTSVPAMLLELLSHMNFEDMKYGLDPKFRFDVSRACYKGILKYLSLHYGCTYAVQPLPVSAFTAKAEFSPNYEGYATLNWNATVDKLEPTAVPKAYFVYTRVDGKGWNEGCRVTTTSHKVKIEPGHIYSFKVVAENEGGLSFPSEILSVGLASPYSKNILVVNNFNRVSGPSWIDVPGYAGFDNISDSGVPYIRDWCYIGDQYKFRRGQKYSNGFGASHSDYADRVTAGNNFDYPYVHGVSILDAGYNFSSCSAESFTKDYGLCDKIFAVDLICGKECMVRTGNRSKVRGGVFPKSMRDALTLYTEMGCNVIISGSYIARDVFDSVFQLDDDIPDRKQQQDFVKDVLGYGLMSSCATKNGCALTVDGSVGQISFPMRQWEESYCVESPDALSALGLGSQVYMTYADSGMPAALNISHPRYKITAFGFPLELIYSEKSRNAIFRNTLKFFEK